MTPSAQLTSFLARYSPEIRAVTWSAYRKLRQRLPGATVLVYDNFNALVIGFGASERASEAVLSLALYPRWINLFFLYGATLPDPDGILLGSGSQVRRILVESAATLDRPDVRRLIAEAVRRADPPVATKGRGPIVIRAISKKQRPRRP
jgi:hypothetical protein